MRIQCNCPKISLMHYTADMKCIAAGEDVACATMGVMWYSVRTVRHFFDGSCEEALSISLWQEFLLQGCLNAPRTAPRVSEDTTLWCNVHPFGR